MDLVTIDQASKMLDIDIDLIRNWAKKGLLNAVKYPNSDRLFSIAQLGILKNGKTENQMFKILKSKKTEYSVVELFAGCGGLALGFENAGLNSHLLVEIDKNAVQTLKINRPHWNVVEDDIHDVDFGEFEDNILDPIKRTTE